jgi:RHS repeat-associated protein
VVLNGDGTVDSEARYYPYGVTRWSSGTLPTDYRFTGQREDGYIKLTVMGARWYDGQLGRWISPDSIIPDPANPQSFNRFSYTRNNPVKFRDPSGHMEIYGGSYEPYSNYWYTYVNPNAPGCQASQERIAQIGSLAVDFTTGLGDAKGFIEAFVGKDLLTGEPLGLERLLGLVFLSELRHADEVLELGAAAIKRADAWVAKYGVQATLDAARLAAKNGDPVLPGLFKYTDETMESISGYQKHHLWPEALGGPKDGWAVYVRSQNPNFHTAIGGIQNWVDQRLMVRTGLRIDELRAWANANPDQLLPMLREVYADLGIDFPY